MYVIIVNLLSHVGNDALQFPDGKHTTKLGPNNELPLEHEKCTSVFIFVSLVFIISPFFRGIEGQ